MFCSKDDDRLQRQRTIHDERVLDCHLLTTPRMHVGTTEARESPVESTPGQYLQPSADSQSARKPWRCCRTIGSLVYSCAHRSHAYFACSMVNELTLQINGHHNMNVINVRAGRRR